MIIFRRSKMDQNSSFSNDICTKKGTELEWDSQWIAGVTTSTRTRSDLVAMVRLGAEQLSPNPNSKWHVSRISWISESNPVYPDHPWWMHQKNHHRRYDFPGRSFLWPWTPGLHWPRQEHEGQTCSHQEGDHLWRRKEKGVFAGGPNHEGFGPSQYLQALGDLRTGPSLVMRSCCFPRWKGIGCWSLVGMAGVLASRQPVWLCVYLAANTIRFVCVCVCLAIVSSDDDPNDIYIYIYHGYTIQYMIDL